MSPERRQYRWRCQRPQWVEFRHSADVCTGWKAELARRGHSRCKGAVTISRSMSDAPLALQCNVHPYGDTVLRAPRLTFAICPERKGRCVCPANRPYESLPLQQRFRVHFPHDDPVCLGYARRTLPRPGTLVRHRRKLHSPRHPNSYGSPRATSIAPDAEQCPTSTPRPRSAGSGHRRLCIFRAITEPSSITQLNTEMPSAVW